MLETSHWRIVAYICALQVRLIDFGLRNYQVKGQIGLEESVDEYVSNLVNIFREVRRVLRPDGVLWLNLGDSYNGSGGAGGDYNKGGIREGQPRYPGRRVDGLKPKDLIGVPWRVAFALQEDGWWLRADCIWCLSGGTRVYARTQKGDMPMSIKDMARLRSETVQLWNGERWTNLLGLSKSKRRGDEIEITLRSGERIECTPTHKFPTERGLVDAGHLVLGDCLVRTTIPEPERLRDCAIDSDAAWFAGLYIAEGSHSGDVIQISGHSKEEMRWNRVNYIAGKYGGSATRTVNGNSMNIRVYGKVLNAILSELVGGKTAKDKHFSPVVWRYSNDFLRAMMDGYLAGDGSYDKKNNRWRLGFTRNYALERDLRTACARLGWKLILNLSTVSYRGIKSKTFRGEIRKTRTDYRTSKNDSEIIRITRSKCQFVYDIGVADEPHLFALSTGILTHNSKPNVMPTSATDRPTISHEYMFLLTKNQRYFYDADAVREPLAKSTIERNNYPHRGRKNGAGEYSMTRDRLPGEQGDLSGRNMRSVWTVSTTGYSGGHFAVFPAKLIEPCILAGTSERGVCPMCGAPWKRIVRRKSEKYNGNEAEKQQERCGGLITGGTERVTLGVTKYVKRETLGWKPTCNCPIQEPTPAIVLDPFVGSGTTLAVSAKLGRSAIGIELNPEYNDLIKGRITGVQMAIKV